MSSVIMEMPSAERPRERLKSHGARALSSSELLAILLGTGSEKHSALKVGHEILASAHGSLRRLSTQPVAALTAIAGVGNARAVAIHAALELGRRMAAEEREDGIPVRGPRDVHQIFAQRLEDLPVEEFHVAVLDSQHRLERDVTVTRGFLIRPLYPPGRGFRKPLRSRRPRTFWAPNPPTETPRPRRTTRKRPVRSSRPGRLLT